MAWYGRYTVDRETTEKVREGRRREETLRNIAGTWPERVWVMTGWKTNPPRC